MSEQEQKPTTERKKRYEFIEDIPGIGPATAEKLRELGFHTVESLATATVKELTQAGVGEKQAAKIIGEARNTIATSFVRADELMRMRQSVLRLSMGSKQLDELVGGGLESQTITELYGEFGVGKSILCHQLAVNAQLPLEQGGLNGGALYVDTENTFRPEWIIRMASPLGLDPETAGKNIIYSEAFNSLPGDERVLVLNDGALHELAIGEVVEKRADRNVQTFAFDQIDCTMRVYPVTKLIKHTIGSGEFYKFRTEYGREITVTGAHSLFVGERHPYPYIRRKGNMRPIEFPASLLRVGDRIAIPRRLPVPAKDIEGIDLAEGLKEVGEELSVDDRNVRLKHTGRHPATGIPRFIRVDSDLLWLIGFFLAEGDYTIDERGRVLGIRFSSGPEYLRTTREIIHRLFPKIHTFRDRYSLGVRSRLLALTFEKALKIQRTSRGVGSNEKQIPDWIMQLQLGKVKHFMKGYWDGDGNHTRPRKRRMILHTSSRRLAEALALLLLRFGVMANIHPINIHLRPRWRRPYTVEAAGLSSNNPLDLEQVTQDLHAPTRGDIVFAKVKSVEREMITSPTTVYDFAVKPDGKAIENFVGGFGGVCCHNSDHQILILEKADKVIQENNIKLIIVDSLTSHFRSEYLGREMLAERQQKLNSHMHRLVRLARAFNAVAVVTNQVMAKPDAFFASGVEAVGGHIVAHTSHTRIFLRRATGGPVRIARLVSSPYLPEGCLLYTSDAADE